MLLTINSILHYDEDMLKSISKEWTAKIAFLIFIIHVIWWITFQFSQTRSDFSVQLFGSTYGILAAWGGIVGITIAQKWGGFKSVLGRAIMLFSLGLLAQEFGQIAYTVYIYILHVEIPYPSIGDIGYFGSVFLYIYASILLAKTAGVKILRQSFKNKLQAIIIPLIMLALSYILFLQGYEFDYNNPLKIFLDFGYPMGQAIYLSIAILTFILSFKMLGGVMRNKVLFILFALFIQYLADYTFLYQVSNGTWTTGGINELMYLISYLFMTLSLIEMKSPFSKEI